MLIGRHYTSAKDKTPSFKNRIVQPNRWSERLESSPSRAIFCNEQMSERHNSPDYAGGADYYELRLLIKSGTFMDPQLPLLRSKAVANNLGRQ